jgi:hypothetical protein
MHLNSQRPFPFSSDGRPIGPPLSIAQQVIQDSVIVREAAHGFLGRVRMVRGANRRDVRARRAASVFVPDLQDHLRSDPADVV